MKKIKVLHMLNTSDIGGAEKLLLDICRYTDKDKFDLIITSFQKGALENEFKRFSYVKKIDLNDSKQFSFKTLRRLNKIIKKERIDIIQTHLQKPDLYGFLLKLKNPHVTWIIKKGNTDDYRTKLFWRISNGFIHRFANLVIPTSNQVKEFTKKIEFVPEKKFKVIYSGIDTAAMDLALKKDCSKKLKKELGFKKTDKVIISVGRLVYQKGFSYLIRIMKELTEQDKRYKLLIVGDGPLKSKLESLILNLKVNDNVKLLGERTDVIDLLQISDLFCLTSVKEGIPITLMEAMYVGVPIVTTNVGGNKELVQHGQTGFLEKAKDISSIKQRIKQLLHKESIRKKFIENARKTILARFSIIKTTRNYEKVYIQLKK